MNAAGGEHMPGARIEDDARALVVEMYAEGAKLSEIERRTGVSRGSLYNILREQEIPLRRTPAKTGTWDYSVTDGTIHISVAEQTRQLERALNEIGRLQERNRILAQIAVGLAKQLNGDTETETIAFVHTLMEQG